jgi:hypothetical protein
MTYRAAPVEVVGGSLLTAVTKVLLDSSQPKSILKLTELRGRQSPSPLDQVIPRQGDQPRAKDVAVTRKCDAHDAFVRKPLASADLDLHAHTTDVSARGGYDLLHRPGVRRLFSRQDHKPALLVGGRGGNNLHRSELRRLFSRQEHNRALLVDERPPDLAAFHSSPNAGRRGNACVPRSAA